MSDQEFDELDKKLAEAEAAQAARAEQPKRKQTASQKESRKRTTDERQKRSDYHQDQEDTNNKQAATQWNRASQEEPLYTRRRPAEPGRGRGRGWLKKVLWIAGAMAALLLAVETLFLVKNTASPEEVPQRVVDTRMTFTDFILAQEPPEPELEEIRQGPHRISQGNDHREASKGGSFIRDLSHLLFGD
jgi:hypothetical protein